MRQEARHRESSRGLEGVAGWHSPSAMASRMALDMLSDRDELTSTVALLMRAWHSAGASVGHTRTPLNLERGGKKNGESCSEEC